MSDCASFEIAVDQRHHGALPSGEVPGLEAHLSACAACRAYQAAAQAMDLRLGEQARAAGQEVEWERIERSVRGGLRSGIRFLLYDLLVGAAVIPAAALAFGRAGHRLALAAVVAAAVAVPVLARALYLTWSARRTAELQERIEDLLLFRRAQLRGTLRRLMVARWLALPAIAWLVVQALPEPGRSDGARLFMAAAGVLVAGSWVHDLLVKAPRLRRELAELEPGGRSSP